MFGNLLQRLKKSSDEHLVPAACCEVQELLVMIADGDYDQAIEFMIFESHFNPCCAFNFARNNASSACQFAQFEQALINYAERIEAKEFFYDEIMGEHELAERLEQLKVLIHSLSETVAQ
jgi:hypothetical protein